ncbi:hypothetical protein [Streptomyces aureus]|uniref:hypothetical protein n=1 Tax=Streptomyces aureus TaxID=193461 RepID=UPI0033E363DF
MSDIKRPPLAIRSAAASRFHRGDPPGGGDEVAVTVSGVGTAELELRADTLLAAFAAG